jgi:hypothetical protein
MASGMTPPPHSTSSAHEIRILFVSHLPAWRGASPDASRGRFGEDIEVVDFAAVDADLLASFDPHFVVSPILTPGFDVIDLATRLWQLRFRGAYRILTDGPLPDPGLVLREVRSQCPGLDIDLIPREALLG